MDETCLAGDDIGAFKSLINRALIFYCSVFTSSTALSNDFLFAGCQPAVLI